MFSETNQVDPSAAKMEIEWLLGKLIKALKLLIESKTAKR